MGEQDGQRGEAWLIASCRFPGMQHMPRSGTDHVSVGKTSFPLAHYAKIASPFRGSGTHR